MKIFDKLKNALFEEEYVEVEEKPKIKPVKAEKPKKEKRDFLKKQEVMPKREVKEEKPIAKKIAPPKREEEKPKVEEKVEEPIEDVSTKRRTDFRFPVVEDKDLKTDNYNVDFPDFIENKAYEQEMPKKQVPEKPEKSSKIKPESKPLYQAKNEETDYDVETHEYGLYEKQHEKAYFKPSPIISPIYGVLDKNYKKEEVKDKKEIRLTSSYARDRINVDDVRKKAFGSLSDDIERAPVLEKVDPIENDDYEDEVDTEENILFDLRDNEEAPEVDKITVGDAEEYFQDLGLEYNNDYIDTSKDKGKKKKTESPMIEVPDEEETEQEESPSLEDNEIAEDESLASTEKKEDTDSLFDLIDSMYDDI